jgi:hypothetical protein
MSAMKHARDNKDRKTYDSHKEALLKKLNEGSSWSDLLSSDKKKRAQAEINLLANAGDQKELQKKHDEKYRATKKKKTVVKESSAPGHADGTFYAGARAVYDHTDGKAYQVKVTKKLDIEHYEVETDGGGKHKAHVSNLRPKQKQPVYKSKPQNRSRGGTNAFGDNRGTFLGDSVISEARQESPKEAKINDAIASYKFSKRELERNISYMKDTVHHITKAASTKHAHKFASRMQDIADAIEDHAANVHQNYEFLKIQGIDAEKE